MREHERIRFELGLCIRCERIREKCRTNKQTCRECARIKSNQVLINYHNKKTSNYCPAQAVRDFNVLHG